MSGLLETRKEIIRAMAIAICKRHGHNPFLRAVRGDPVTINGLNFTFIDNHRPEEETWEIYRLDAEVAYDALMESLK